MVDTYLVRVLVIGATGQDGSILVSQYLRTGCEVFGVTRDAKKLKEVSLRNRNFQAAVDVDLYSPKEAMQFLRATNPDIIFHLAAIHASSTNMARLGQESFDEMHMCHVEITRNILNWQRENISAKLVVALSSQMYSSNTESRNISENSMVFPSTKYGETKAEAFSLIKNYRQKYGVRAGGAILFNHTSTLSRKDFLFQVVAKQIVEIIAGNSNEVSLRNPEASLDICSAEEVCEGLILLSSLEMLDDFVFSSGKEQTIRKVIMDVFELCQIDSKPTIVATQNYSEVQKSLVGNPAKAKKLLGWQSRKMPSEILYEMVIDQVKQTNYR